MVRIGGHEELNRIRELGADVWPVMKRRSVLEDFRQAPRFQDQASQLGMIGPIGLAFVLHQVQAISDGIVDQLNITLSAVLKQCQLADSVEQPGGVGVVHRQRGCLVADERDGQKDDDWNGYSCIRVKGQDESENDCGRDDNS